MEATLGVPHVVIIGGGFAGLTAAKALRGAPVDVTLLDRTNHHLFQPLLYQVASAGLSPADIASPIRSILAHQKNARVLLAEVSRIDVNAKKVYVDEGELAYDFLVVAAGAHTNYFGHDDWEPFAPGLKSLEDAVEVRRRVLLAFERAERAGDEATRRRLLTFVVIGGGPTGVETSGAFSELSRFVLDKDFRSIKPEETRVILLEAGPRILAAFAEDLSRHAVEQLEELGVEVRTGAMVTAIDDDGVHLGAERIETSTVVWAAGVSVSPLARALGTPLDRQGRAVVGEDLTIPGHPEVFAIGDMAHFEQDGKPVPGLSPVAMQQARAVARSIKATLAGEPRRPFRYVDKGTMATIGRSRAVAEAKGIHLHGFIAWLAWLFVHIWYLIGFRNRVIVMFEWLWSYVTYKRGARLITGQRWDGSRAALSLRGGHVREQRGLPPPAGDGAPVRSPAALAAPAAPLAASGAPVATASGAPSAAK
jgi:NADH dehydrogenase